MKYDLDIYAVLYVLQVISLIAAYFILLYFKIEKKIEIFFKRKFRRLKYRSFLSAAALIFTILMPVAVVFSTANLVWLAMNQNLTILTAGRSLTQMAINFICFSAIILSSHSVLSGLRFFSRFHKHAVTAVMLSCASIMFVFLSAAGPKLLNNFEMSDLNAEESRSVHTFLDDTAYSDVNLKVIEADYENAHASGNEVFITRPLLETLLPVELNTVVAHEIGHLHSKDAETLGGILGFAILIPFCTILTFYLLYKLFSIVSRKKSLTKIRLNSFCASIILFLILIPFAKIGFTQFKRIAEVEADKQAVQYLLYKNQSIDNMENVFIKMNKHNPNPGHLADLLFYDHPALNERLTNIREFEREFSEQYKQK